MAEQALSLKCNVCGAQLRSVKEAQDHGEATGHADFSESTEAVVTMVCIDCGKPCRSKVEQDMHTRATGHSTFVDKTSEEAKALDTEKQMKDARQEHYEELGLPTPMETEEPAADGAEASSSEEMVTPEVSEELMTQLQEMGFGENRCRRALHATGTDSLEQAVAWLAEHAEDADIDEPLLVPKANAAPKKKLTKEEAKAKAEEIRRNAAARKAKEEKEMEKLREAERIRSGKELLEAKRKEEEYQRKRNIEARRLEKEEEERARQKVKARLEEDRRARRRKLGLPEELTEEEKAKEAEREAEKARKEKEAAEKKAKHGIVVKPVKEIDRLRATLVQLKRDHMNETDRTNTAFKTLLTYCGNLARAPGEEKFRKIRLGNAAFQTRVGSLSGGIAFLEGLGFVRDAAGEFLEIPQDKINQVLVNAAGDLLNSALTNPHFGIL
mmetsp:Transcript_9192/g.30306  ORF Transcript_9192/g.30306 Transcript_9192/m.30306 type:complete len:441 (-) Transcript_9192:83-1405(-)|eukprot:CAMPEP_0170145322 /NCGR_PEP_ID=MMETSP0033_2-20121228/16449_1 /TAXON_ID=195969 /ORGANISM="Dolichomastix tenuilepis, Strain CCMP3274" /LENGTH=440 /DNA_ID=CAMNT_0010381867 /DNA_START=26 /DNA_END=1348 /DNA_ORIENTATION=-